MTRLLHAAALALALLPCPLLRGQTASIPLEAGAPPSAASVGASYTGPAGLETYYYWVVVNYPIGKSGLGGPAVVSGVGALSGGNVVTIAWQALPGASSYDVLRTATPVYPSTASCDCAVETGVTALSATDDGSSLSSYSLSSISVVRAQMRLNNRDAAAPRVEFVLNGNVVAAMDSTGIVVGGGAGDVTAANPFGADNRLLRSDGTAKGLQASNATLDDDGNLTLPGSLQVGGVSATPITFEGATADDYETTVAVTDPTADRTFTIPNADSVAVQPATCSAGDFVTAVSAAGAVTCATPAGGGAADPTLNIDMVTFIEEFPCRLTTEGMWGSLGWMGIGGVHATNSGCPASGTRGYDILVPNSGNTWTGKALSRNSGISRGVISQLASVDWEAVWIFQLADNTENIWKFGIGDDTASETGAHDTNQEVVMLMYKSETTDTASECFGTTGSSANFQAYTRSGANTAGLQDLGLALSTTGWYRVRMRNTATPGVEICVVADSSNPTYTACYEETTGANIPTTSLMTPFMGVMSCDGSTLSTNIMRLDYFHLKHERYY